MKKRFNLLSLGLAVSILGSSLSLGNAYANQTNTNKEISAMEINEDNSINKKVQVEVLFDSTNGDFVKNITFDDGTKLSDYEYEIVKSKQTKSYALRDYVNYAAWITRDGVVSLSIEPKDNVRNSKSEKDTAWSYISSPTHGFGSSSNWRNGKVMGWQFDCHYSFANSKTYWNLEPHRTAGSYMEVVASGCNP